RRQPFALFSVTPALSSARCGPTSADGVPSPLHAFFKEPLMEAQNNRAVLDQHWAASASGDLEAEHQIYDENVLCEYPQSGEKIHGRRNLKALRGHHPGKPSGFMIRRIEGMNDLWVTEYIINYEKSVVQTVSIMEFQNGRVIHETQ